MRGNCATYFDPGHVVLINPQTVIRNRVNVGLGEYHYFSRRGNIHLQKEMHVSEAHFPFKYMLRLFTTHTVHKPPLT